MNPLQLSQKDVLRFSFRICWYTVIQNSSSINDVKPSCKTGPKHDPTTNMFRRWDKVLMLELFSKQYTFHMNQNSISVPFLYKTFVHMISIRLQTGSDFFFFFFFGRAVAFSLKLCHANHGCSVFFLMMDSGEKFT